MFGFKKNKAPAKWDDLTKEQKIHATRKIVKALESGARYKIVSGSD